MKRTHVVEDAKVENQNVMNRNASVIKDCDDDSCLSPAILKYLLNVERLEQDIKIGKLFPNGVTLIR